MPIYCYTNEEESEYIEIFQGMNDEHSYTHTDGKKWRRVFQIPQASIDTKTDVWNTKDFVEKSGRKKGNLGNLWDAAQSASDKRAQEAGGIDPIKSKYQNETYRQKRSGAEHPSVTKAKTIEKIKKAGFTVSE